MISYKLYLAWLGVDFVLPLSQQQEQQEEDDPLTKIYQKGEC